MMLLTIILTLILIPYLLMVVIMGRSWRKHPVFRIPDEFSKKSISLIIPARNEAGNILACLESIAAQDYDPFEVLVVNDHSDDETFQLVKGYAEKSSFNIKLYDLPVGTEGKKRALDFAIRQAGGELIVTTDADCIMATSWLRALAAYQDKTGAAMIAGPVVYHKEKNLFEKLQSVDFLAMTGVGAAASFLGHPVIGNGANLCFERKAYEEAGGYEGTYASVSGDDVFLLHKFKQIFAGRVHYLKSPEAMVYTQPSADLKSFMHQKLRWASKTKYYRDPSTLVISGILMSVNLVLLAAFLSLGIVGESFSMMLSLFVVKLLADLYFMIPFFSFSGKRSLLLLFFPVQLFYPAYIAGISIFAPFVKFSWKGRKSTTFH